jgi:hypothetical protein
MSRNKKATIYLHIGLPKTATTTLQKDFFPFCENMKYLGVFQPRGLPNDDLYSKIYKAVNTGIDIENTRNELNSMLIYNGNLIISEELITVSSQDSNWLKKIQNLGVLVSDVNYKVLVTVREPIDALFSFYVELYDRYRNSEAKFVDLASTHDDFKIYNYDYLLKELANNLDLNCIMFYPFERLVEGDISGLRKFLDEVEMTKHYNGLKNNNKRKSSNQEILLEKHLPLNWIRQVHEILGGKRNKILEPARQFLKPLISWLRMLPAGNIRIPKPTDQEKQILKEKMAGTSSLIEKYFGISYLTK